MRKWLRRCILITALLLLALQSILWVASYRWGHLALLYPLPDPPRHRRDFLIIASDRGVWRVHRFFASSIEGALWNGNLGPFDLSRPYIRGQYGPEDSNSWKDLVWYRFEPQPPTRGHEEWFLAIPALWTVAPNALVVAIIIVPSLRARRHRAHLARSECAGCGYDLRGNPAAQRCPECGETIPPSAAVAK